MLDHVYIINFFFWFLSTRPIRFGLALPHRERDDNKENSKPQQDTSKDDDSDGDGPVLYREDEDEHEKDDAGKN